jgi:hypothetical protein
MLALTRKSSGSRRANRLGYWHQRTADHNRGNELVAQLDVLHLVPHSQVTRVYDVPRNKLTLFADGIAGQGSDGMDLLIYGSK